MWDGWMRGRKKCGACDKHSVQSGYKLKRVNSKSEAAEERTNHVMRKEKTGQKKPVARGNSFVRHGGGKKNGGGKM